MDRVYSPSHLFIKVPILKFLENVASGGFGFRSVSTPDYYQWMCAVLKRYFEIKTYNQLNLVSETCPFQM